MYKNKGLKNVTAKITSTPAQIKINCPDEKSFRTVQIFLETNQESIQYFSFPTQEERTLKIAIKGIPLYISDTELSNELTMLGYQPQLVRAFSKMEKEFLYTWSPSKCLKMQKSFYTSL